MKRLSKIVTIFAVTGAALWVVSRVLYARRRTKTEEVPDEPFFERRSEPDPDSLAAMSTGNFDRIGLDVGRLKELESNNYKPLVQYLTAIQVKRGEMGETLLFDSDRVSSGRISEDGFRFAHPTLEVGLRSAVGR